MAARRFLTVAGGIALTAQALECNITGYYWDPQDMPYSMETMPGRMEECALNCLNTPNCTHYAYWPDGACHHANASSVLVHAVCDNCTGLNAIAGAANCSDESTYPNPALAVDAPSGEGVTGGVEASGGGSFPVWAWLLGLGLLGCFLGGIAYLMGVCGDEERKKKKKKSQREAKAVKAADVESARPESQPLVSMQTATATPVAVPTVTEPVPMYSSVPAGQPTYMVQAAPAVAMQQPVMMVQR